MQNHLIRRRALVARLVQLFIRTVLVITERDLLALLDRRVDNLDIVKQSLIVRFAPFVHRPDIFDVRTEIFVGERTQFFDEFFGMPGGDVLARKHAVDEHTEFGIPELARSEITSAAVGQNIIPCIFEKKDVAADRLAFDNDAVISVEIAGDISTEITASLSNARRSITMP